MQNKRSKRLLIISISLGLGLGMMQEAAQAATTAPATAAVGHYHALTGNPSGTYQIDPEHSAAYFTIGHVGIGPFSGRFNKISGTYTVNTQDPAKDTAKIVIPAASIFTNFAPRDKYLRSPTFFDVKKYPDVTFVSTRYQPISKTTGDLYGKLTLHGVTRAIMFRVRETGAGDVKYLPKPWGGYLSGFVAVTTIQRSNYGMKAYLPEGLSNKVHIRVEIEGKKIA
ncbi:MULTISPECIES: YceI family protein [Acidithiobacillus]|uniref:YceI family protein n=1 Tax=Acidithiobacillus TaxID=119977 RepID=UPI00094AE527|nr:MULTISPECIES: YceI family protein [Acidithiobacillus]MBE7565783.1 YceI family protein [Acidithiobacillus sp. HP-11]MBU2792391.1 YceI family protein [Acidithiobacillus thiooxidans]